MSTQSFGPFTLAKRLATGGMAEVWLAKQEGIEGFERHVVVKRILPHLAEDEEFIQMFLNEARIAARFSHPNIAQIFDLGEVGGEYYLAMEFVHGEDLGQVMRRAWNSGQWVARPTALRIIADACAGLHYAHTRTDEAGRPLRVVHRDVSPQNILVSFDGSVKLVDFGIAKAVNQRSLTRSGAIKGKFAYMAPEQASGKPLDARCDIFALGLVLYELVTGVRPLKRDSELATLQAALEAKIDAPSRVAEVPEEIDDLVMTALARSPDDRYPDARAFQLALEKHLVAEGAVATSVQVSELMTVLFGDRLDEEARSGEPEPTVSKVQSAKLRGQDDPDQPERGDSKRPGRPGRDSARTGSAARGGSRAGSSGRGGDRPGTAGRAGGSEPGGTGSQRSNGTGAQDRGRAAVQRTTEPEDDEDPNATRVASDAGSDADSDSDVEAGDGLDEDELERDTDPEPAPVSQSRRDAARGGGRAARSGRLPRGATDGGDDDDGERRKGSGPGARRAPSGGGTAPSAGTRRPPSRAVDRPLSRSQTGRSGGGSDRPRSGASRGPSMDWRRAPPGRRDDAGEPEVSPGALALLIERAKEKLGGPSLQRPPTRIRDFHPGPADVTSWRELGEARWRKGVWLVGGAVALVLVGLLVYLLMGSGPAGVPVQLVVTSRPETEVRLVPPAGGRRAPRVLGRTSTPLEVSEDVYAGDVVQLSNAELGLSYEQAITAGVPNELIRIERTFREGTVRIRTSPEVAGGSIYRGDKQVGLVGSSVRLYEGRQKLTISSSTLSEPFEFELDVRPGDNGVHTVRVRGDGASP